MTQIRRVVSLYGPLRKDLPSTQLPEEWEDEPPIESRWEGMIVYAPAVSWDPGSGSGWYGWARNTWTLIANVDVSQDNVVTDGGDNVVTDGGDNVVTD